MEAGEPTSLQIEKQSLHDQVASRIRDLIIEGHLEPGSRIDEAKLVEQLGVSRTPFREALRTLAAEGLIVIRPARGSMVRKLSRADVFSMLEVLAEMERLAGRTACERASDSEIAHARDLHERMLEYYRSGERMPYYKLNQEFHTFIASLSRNETLCEIQGNIMARLKRIRFIGNSEPEHWRAAVDDHEEMMDALAARDGQRLGDIMAHHLSETWQRVKNVI
ncbi:DNA-binding transcriptional regulator, GntR family [Tranquillimonas rosea]|uniref:DNA-binding transcriptional regulator, GntR family n=1 Tax=Tranquillimonas rosea TaxID=641238 RepID=A0A1H9WV27_9RHOB|nr:GntR family transcriptional regulator [Tranquillimonas rosea]SES37679.1 DNA-binding transcriptional regulator, GntR family [Tranquillimonas rosea]